MLVTGERVQTNLIMRCLFSHRWGRSIINVQFSRAYRTCARCGTMQRGVFDRFWDDISWETVRERTYIESQAIRIVREPVSRLGRLAHSFWLRRSRTGDGRQSLTRTVFRGG